MSEKFELRPYWKPEPKLYGIEFLFLFLPALTYIIGVILFGGEAIVAGAITGATQGTGSVLMIVGGEVGTLASAGEVFKKHRDGEANLLDWLGLIVSLAATLGTLFVVYAKLTPLVATWVQPVRDWGPLVLLLCSGLDFYANIMELSFFRSHFGDAWDKWNAERHKDELKQRANWHELMNPVAKVETKEGELVPVRKPTIHDWREITAKLNGDRAGLTVIRVNELLTEHHFEQVADSTARYWLKDTKGVN